jgi:Fur family ferric uptake transcriptional regulator
MPGDFRIDRGRPVRYSLMRMSLNKNEADTRKPVAGRAVSCPDPEVERFRHYFQDGGLPFTEQRRRILEEVCRSASHFDAEELYGRIRRRRVPASRATLYRTLGHLERAGVLRRIDIGGDHAHFEFVGADHHEHLVCTRCGRVVEINEPDLEARVAALLSAHGFSTDRHAMQVFGECGECRGAARAGC